MCEMWKAIKYPAVFPRNVILPGTLLKDSISPNRSEIHLRIHLHYNNKVLDE